MHQELNKKKKKKSEEERKDIIPDRLTLHFFSKMQNNRKHSASLGNILFISIFIFYPSI
jgi:hypothetical protein